VCVHVLARTSVNGLRRERKVQDIYLRIRMVSVPVKTDRVSQKNGSVDESEV
jgi:hypothetical protein